MSTDGGDGGGPGDREVAFRLFAAEYDDATLSYSESDEERAPNYVVTPTGARVNRLFVGGVLTEVEPVNEEMLRARVVDPSGAFVVYAGQYQPDELAVLERADPPTFVAVTGKARTFQPDDADTIYTSVRPESINEVDAETRDRWTVGTAERTLQRIATMANALRREERGDALRDALLEEGVPEGVAHGIPLAIDHYGTTPGYLDALRELSLDAARLVAGEVEEVTAPGPSPDEDRPGVDAASLASAIEAPPVRAADRAEPHPEEGGAETDTATGEAVGEGDGTEPVTGAGSTEVDSTDDLDGVEPGEFDDDFDDLDDDPGESGISGAGDEEFDPDEFELDEEERREVEEEYGTEFETGTEVSDPGEADIEPETEPATAGSETAAEPESDIAEQETESGAPESDEPEPEPETEEAAPDESEAAEPEAEGEEPEPEAEESEAGEPEESADEDVDLTEAVLSAMDDLDDGGGADRDAIVERVVDAHDIGESAVDEAIQDALMSGRCFEPEDGVFSTV